jgi:biotin transport system substrate-specific component
MLVGLSLGARLGFLSLLTYIGVGAVGAPVFAGFSGGPAKLLGPTGGYLVAFVIGAALLGWMSDRGWTRKVWGSALCVALVSVLTLGMGAGWLSAIIGAAAWKVGFLNYVGAEALKAAIAIPVIPSAWALLGKTYRSGHIGKRPSGF